jgi:hypothetical protein
VPDLVEEIGIKKLIYYLKHGNNLNGFDGLSAITEQLTQCSYGQMNDANDADLRAYIEALEKNLTIAKAIEIIRREKNK